MPLPGHESQCRSANVERYCAILYRQTVTSMENAPGKRGRTLETSKAQREKTRNCKGNQGHTTSLGGIGGGPPKRNLQSSTSDGQKEIPCPSQGRGMAKENRKGLSNPQKSRIERSFASQGHCRNEVVGEDRSRLAEYTR